MRTGNCQNAPMSSQFIGCASLELTNAGTVVSLKGDWKIGTMRDIDALINALPANNQTIQRINTCDVTRMDTAGAFLLYSLQKKLSTDKLSIQIEGLRDNFHALLTLVKNDVEQIIATPIALKHSESIFYRIGKSAVHLYQRILSLFAFLGEIATLLLKTVFVPLKLQWRSMINEIDIGGYRALPIIAVMMFLIGVVVAYQLGVQLRIYGANIYMVDLSGVAILREFAPLICSVIIAGRTSTSFAALLGTMKVNEEIDALETMGLSPVERLVLPKIIGMLVALPLLVVWGDLFGLFGSMMMAKSMAGIDFTAFLDRFRQEVPVKHLYLGLVKTPVFALIVAGIGCYQGFQAQGSAESVGARTTKAAVQAIFLIILADGLFSILFNWMDL